MIIDQTVYEALPGWAKFLALAAGFRPTLPPAAERQQRRDLDRDVRGHGVQPWGRYAR